GTPVVASRIGGIPELVQDGRNGLLFEPGNADDLCRVLSRLVDEPGLLDTLRNGNSPVRTIEEDVALARRLYEASLSSPFRAATTAHRARLAAIVLNYRTPDDTLLAVRSLLASRRRVDQVIVVDNDPIDEPCKTEIAGLAGVTYLRKDENLGFS